MKQILLEKFERFSGESWVWFLGWVSILFGIIIISITIIHDKPVRCYYLSTKSTDLGVAYDINIDINWMPDGIAFRSTDIRTTMEVFSQLPQCKGDE